MKKFFAVMCIILSIIALISLLACLYNKHKNLK